MPEQPMNSESDPKNAPTSGANRSRGSVRAFIKLARPHQWTKAVFVLVGPAFAVADGSRSLGSAADWAWSVALTLAAMCLAASGCYVLNDLADIERDKAHPRKKFRPLPSGQISPGAARAYGFGLILTSVLCSLLVTGAGKWWVLILVLLYIANVQVYTSVFKRIAIVDVLCLSTGFVLRVLAGCAAAMVAPSTWLLNVTLFLSMFLAFGKRLGERRVMGGAENAAQARDVQGVYSDQLLRMFVVVTGVASLLTYTGYVQSREMACSVILARDETGAFSFNLLWITVMPVMLGLARTITLLMHGKYDDPTEIAIHDHVVRLSAILFVLSSGLVFLLVPYLAA